MITHPQASVLLKDLGLISCQNQHLAMPDTSKQTGVYAPELHAIAEAITSLNITIMEFHDMMKHQLTGIRQSIDFIELAND